MQAPSAESEPASNATSTSLDARYITLEVTDHTRLFAGIAALDDTTRDLLRDALRDHASAEADRKIMRTIREVLAQEEPDLTPVGAMFSTIEADNGYFLSAYGQVLFTDGTVTEIDFDDIHQVLTDEFGARGERFTVNVDLRPDAVTEIDDDDYSDGDIWTRFRVPRPKDPYGQFTVDGIQFDNARSRDTYLKLKALPEPKILYLARSHGHQLKTRVDATYREVADEDTNPDWVTGTAANIALSRGWIDEQEHDRLTR